MKNISGIHIKIIPNKSEIRNYCKAKLIEERLSVKLSLFNRKVLYDCYIWMQGYAFGVSENTSMHPVKDDDLKEFYLDAVFSYLKSRI
jgi:hypothetical protein